MKRTKTARVLAILFLGIIVGTYIHFTELRWIQQGREAFLAAQTHRFERFSAYHSAPAMLVAGIILVAVGAGLYELIASGITSVLPPSTADQ